MTKKPVDAPEPEVAVDPDPNRKQKQIAGTYATLIWLGSGTFLYATTKGVTLLSWPAVIFLFVGMIVASIVFGGSLYLLQQAITKALRTRVDKLTPRSARAILFTGLFLLIVETVAIFFVAYWVFHAIPFFHS